MTPLLFNVMMLALIALKMLVALVILNWINSEPKKAVATVANSPKTRV
jgi:hypothetical protein